MNEFSAINIVSAPVMLAVNNVTETSFLGTVNISEELQLGSKAVLSVLKTMGVYTVRLRAACRRLRRGLREIFALTYLHAI